MTDPMPDHPAATSPDIPRSADFTSARIPDAYDDMVALPGLTNHVAVVQTDHDVVGVRALTVPPVSGGDTPTGTLYVDGRLARSLGGEVEFVWRPDRIERTLRQESWTVRTTTVVPHDVPGVVVRIDVETPGTGEAPTLGLRIDSGVTCPDGAWLSAEPPRVLNTLTVADGIWRSRPGAEGEASITASPIAAGAADDEAISWQLVLDADGQVVPSAPRFPGDRLLQVSGRSRCSYVHLVGRNESELQATLDRVRAGLDTLVEDSERRWDSEIAALFDPEDPTFAGSLPVLRTTNEDLRTLYWWGALGTLWFRRTNPASVLGTTYDTLMPRHWQTTTFIWDYSLSSLFHAFVEPDVMRRQIIHWTSLDINQHFGTEWLTGGPVGYWYSVNQYALVRLVHDYVTVTGDVAFLDESVTGPDGQRRSIADHVHAWATAWKDRADSSGIADYGGIDNLLECVPGYIHGVAGLQAANVWCLRVAADVARRAGDEARAQSLTRDAADLLEALGGLYREGEGFFSTRFPDGSLRPTRHCYDFAVVGTTVGADLDAEQAQQMCTFAREELVTDTWLRALSPADPDAGYSVRPDHQWNGAYPAWPPDAARSLIALGDAETVAAWLPGLARSSRQGPPGQAHFVEEAATPIAGGAAKAPSQYPYLIDWACSSAGSWCELVISGIFGVRHELGAEPDASPALDPIDPEAVLEGVGIGGTRYSIDAHGIHPAGPEN